MANEKLDLIDRHALLENSDVFTVHTKEYGSIEVIPVDAVGDAPTADAVVLPCKIGAAVYRIYDDCEFPSDCGTKMMCKGCDYRNLFIEKQAFCLRMLSQNGKLEHPYYSTRKEAEAALAKMDGGDGDG
jgi:hypothetical protein